MKRYIKQYIIAMLTLCFSSATSYAQQGEKKPNIEELTLEEMKGYTQDDLLQFEFEDLITLVKKFNLSSVDELYAMLLNPTQSTASKMEEDVFNAPLATTVITADELEKSGARSIPEALRLAPGIIVREKTNGNYDVHIRGNDYIPPGSDFSNSVNSTTLVMIDNQPVFNTFLGATFWENLPVSINDLEKIEIIYGPSAALYGPNAVSGVIHLITKGINKEGLSTYVDAQAGNLDSKIVNGAVNYKKGKWGLKLAANYQEMDRFQEDYYIPQYQGTVSGEDVGELNAHIDTSFNASAMSSDYLHAKQQGAINIGATYSPNEKVLISYAGSYQSSSVQTAYMDIGSVLSTRESSSFSNSLNITAGKFDGHFSSTNGHLNAIDGMPGYEYDYTELNVKAGYNFTYKNLVIRPGIDANYSYYSDEDYVDVAANTGMLNGSAELGTVQGSLRLDYTAFDRLRIIGAWMQGYFYKPERAYSSYQFSTSYKASDNTLLRFVLSKSNSSPFVLDTYMNKTELIPNTDVSSNTDNEFMTLNKVGNENLDPLEMHMIELGVRHKFMKNLQADVSVFYNTGSNYSQLVTEQIEVDEPPVNLDEQGDERPPESTDRVITESMQNMDLESSQIGITASLKYVLNEKFNASIFATYQNTHIKNYEVTDEAIYEGITGESIDVRELAENSEYLSFDHDYTPKLYGGGSINYAPNRKWNFNTSFYGFSEQKSFYTKGPEYYSVTIAPKIIGNLKASYQVNKWLNVYANIRNFTNSTSTEFMYTDKTGSSYLLGLNIKL